MRKQSSSGARLRGKVALVTGAGRGLGRAFCESLATEGALVAVAGRDEESGLGTLRLVERQGGTGTYVSMDVTDAESVFGAIDQAARALGGIDILVNNAAAFDSLTRKSFHDISLAEWQNVLDVNVTGAFLCTKAVHPHMRARGYGKIINVSSGSIFLASNRLAHYVTSKMGLIGLTRALARELGEEGIRVNAVAPGATDSGSKISTPEYLSAAASKRSIPRIETPGDVSGAVVFFASPESDFITGQLLVVDGGSVFH